MRKFLNLLAIITAALFLAGCSITSVRLEAAVDKYGVPAPSEEEMGVEEGEDSIEMQDLTSSEIDEFVPIVIEYATDEQLGTIVIDTDTFYLYLVLDGGMAKRYGVAVGREGFGWSGQVHVGKIIENPIWTPPAEMIARKPELEKWRDGMPSGPNNPLGVLALILYENDRDTLYRIHGTNEPDSIGKAVSSGCIRMRNEDVLDLSSRIGVGTIVRVLNPNESVQG